MIKKVLEELNKGKAKTTKELAKQCDINEPMMDGIMDQLINMGYLEKVNLGCSGCDTKMKCSCCSSCGKINENAVRMWQITKKGKQLILS